MISYRIDGENNINVHTEPKCIIEEYVKIPGVGHIDATFDFRKLPPEYHEMVLQMVNHRQNLLLPVRTMTEAKKIVDRDQKEGRKGLFGRFVALFRNK